jgi:L-ribulose-5-phosphate 3-epimerase
MTNTELRFGIGTNSFGNHRLGDALAVIAGLGYDGVALTLDHCHLDPYAPELASRTAKLAARLENLGLAVVVETGARYLLDPWHKHSPTLLGDGRERRVELLRRAVRIAADLGAEAMSFWSGAAPAGIAEDVVWERLTEGCSEVVAAAEESGVTLGFEPEPGMFIDTLDRYGELVRRLGDPARFGLTLDIGHCQCLEPQSPAECVRDGAGRLVNVQIDDGVRGIHEHLEFGAGEISFPPVLAALRDSGYRGLVAVELPRHSHAAPDVARRSLEFLRGAAA